MPGSPPEVYDNITGTGDAFWAALASRGEQRHRPAARQVAARSWSPPRGGTTSAPVAVNWHVLSGSPGTDGASTLNAASWWRHVRPAPACMRCARRAAASACSWPTARCPRNGPPGRLRAAGGDLHDPDRAGRRHDRERGHDQGTAGLDTYACKLMFGDWIWWNDQSTAGAPGLPQGFAAGG